MNLSTSSWVVTLKIEKFQRDAEAAGEIISDIYFNKQASGCYIDACRAGGGEAAWYTRYCSGFRAPVGRIMKAQH